jgi:tetratricopeptide (TPR) repeat protein
MATHHLHASNDPFGERLRQWVLRTARRNREDAAAIYRTQREILHTLECAEAENLTKIVHQINMTLGAYLREYAPSYLAADTPAPQLVGERARAMTLIGDGLKWLEKGELDKSKQAFEEGLSHAEKHGSDHEIAESLVGFARYYDTIDDHAAATEHMERAAKLVFDLNADHSLHIIRLGLAMMYRKQARYKDALGVLDDSPDTQSERARIYRASQQYDLMLKTLERGGDIKPYDKAEGYLQAGLYVEALEAIADAKSTETIYLRAIIYHMQGDLNQAIRGYEMALDVVGQQKPLRIDILLGMAIAYIIQEDLSRARKILIQALEVYPILENANDLMKARVQNLMAALHLLDNDPEIAIKVAKEALTSMKKVSANTGHQERADINRTLGRAYWRLGDQQQALDAFKAEVDHAQSLALRDEKRIGIALHHLADLYQSTRQPDRAIANYRRALTHKDSQYDPLSFFMTQAALHCVLLDEKRFDQALEVNRDAIKHLNAQPPADLQHLGYMLCAQVRALEELDQTDEAFRTLGRWLSTLAGRGDALQDSRPPITLLTLNLGVRSLLASQRADEAQSFAETAVRIAEHYFPGVPVAWSTRRDLGQVYLDLKQPEQAIETLSPLLFDSVKAEPYTYAIAYESTAIAQHQLGKAQPALDNLQRACQHHPVPHKQALILERMANIEVELDHIDAAIDYFHQAIPLLDREGFSGDAARILTSLARVLTGINRYADSIEIYEDSLAMLRSMPDADSVHTARVYVSLGSSHEAQGQYPQAAIAYRNALDTLEASRTASPDDHRTTLAKLAGVQVAMKNYNDAIALYLQSQSETELYGTPQELGLINASLADTYRVSRRYEEALYSYEDALSLQPAVEMPRERAASLRGYGQTLSLVGRLDEARAAWTEALTITTDAPALEIALTHRAIGQAFYAQELYNDAERSFRDALDFHQPNKAETGETWRLLAKAIIADKRYPQSILPLQQALDIEKGLAQQVNGRIVETLDLLADSHENSGDFSAAIACHHEALVYTDRVLQPIETSARFRTLGRLYIIQQRWRDAHTALEEALSIEFNHKPRSDSRIAQTLETIAKAYQSEGHLQKAAEAYKRMASYANLNKSTSDQLQSTLDTIQKHEGILEAAQHSIDVLERTADTELKDIIYVYALIAQSHAKLSNHDASNDAIDKLLTKLENRAHEMSISDERKQYRALAHVFEGSQAASAGDLAEARAHFQMALHDTTDQSMRWVIEQGLQSVQE